MKVMDRKMPRNASSGYNKYAKALNYPVKSYKCC